MRNRVALRRAARGWSQAALAERSGVSRAEISAIETGRVVPSTAVALALARALGESVEALFALGDETARWAGERPAGPALAWRVRLGQGERWLAAERTALGLVPADARVEGDAVEPLAAQDSGTTLVLAGCDPAVGLVAAALGGRRLIALVRPSRAALAMLASGLVHAAGVHLAGEDEEENDRAIRELCGKTTSVVTVARWESGIALARGLARRRGSLERRRLAWVGREEGSGARRLLEEVLGTRRTANLAHIARDHSGVAATIAAGFAQAGPCVRLVAEEAGLDFVPVRRERYELCFRREDEDDPRLVELVRALRSRSLRRELAALPGYDSGPTGDLRTVSGEPEAA